MNKPDDYLNKPEDFKTEQKVTNGIIRDIQEELKEKVSYSVDEWCEIRQMLVDTLNTIRQYKQRKKK